MADGSPSRLITLSLSIISDGRHGYELGTNVILHANVDHIVKDPNRTVRHSHTVQPSHSRDFRTIIVQSRKVMGGSAQAQG